MKTASIQVLVVVAWKAMRGLVKRWSKGVASKFRVRRRKILGILACLVLVCGCAVTSERDLVNGGVEHYVGSGKLEAMAVVDAKGRVVSATMFVVNATGVDVGGVRVEGDEEGLWILLESEGQDGE